MRWAESTGALWLGLAAFLAAGLVPATGGSASECCRPGGLYGGGSGDWEIDEDTTLTEDTDVGNLTVDSGVTLDTAGYILRVCGTLTNYGTITDGVSGGPGGSGGAGGLGGNPIQDSVPSGCPVRGVQCTPGQAGQAGNPPTIPQPGQDGQGGDGGCGGGGGGGAWWNLGQPNQVDADGGDGGAGGLGGKGGGYVRIYALRLANYGVIHADGYPGANGQAAPNSYSTCGAQYHAFGSGIPPNPLKDLVGGGGGGGGGGKGGNGGTVEIHYAYLVGPDLGTVRADGGNGGAGASGGLGGTQQVGHWLTYGADPAGHDTGCPGCDSVPGPGAGGRGAHAWHDSSTNGESGAGSSPGAPGTVIASGQFTDCNSNGIPDECDLSTALLAVSYGPDITLYEVDYTNCALTPLGDLASTISSVASLAESPCTGQIYALVGVAPSGTQWLALIDEGNADVTLIGQLTTPLAAIAFHDDCTLYGIRANGWWIYIVNPLDATLTGTSLHGACGGIYASGLAFRPGTSWLYHAAYSIIMVGEQARCVPCFERIDVQSGASEVYPNPPCPIGPLAFHPFGSPFLAYGGGWSWPLSDYFQDLYWINPDTGNWTLICHGDVSLPAMVFRGPMSKDCNGNGTPDECDIAHCTSKDCQPNGIPDECDVAFGTSADCQGDATPDDCQLLCNDCNLNGTPDDCDLWYLDNDPVNGCPDDCDWQNCNGNGYWDWADIQYGISQDCNCNCIPDECDIAVGPTGDCHTRDSNSNGVPDECESAADCNGNGTMDTCDIARGTSYDCNMNGIPDECEIIPVVLGTADSVGTVCTLPLTSGDSEPRIGRIRQLIFHFDRPPPDVDPILKWDNGCPGPPSFVAYSGTRTMICTPSGNDVRCTFTLGGLADALEDQATYQFDLSPITCNAADMFVISGLVGDVNNSKLVSGADVSSVNANWGTANCRADVNESGSVGGADVSLVNANWGRCAP